MIDATDIRPLMSIEKLTAAIAHCEDVSRFLYSTLDIKIHRQVDQSFYLQKTAEFTLLKEQLAQALKTVEMVQHRAGIHYTEARERWDKDCRIIGHRFKNQYN